jgi:putative Ca2+/H+ antiporter (TMEM165/GDT1 family)
MEAILVSCGAVAMAEIGDKTQLLAILLAARFRAPLPIILGILCATLINHGLAAGMGAAAGDYLSGDVLRWLLVGSFAGMAAWCLLPDTMDQAPSLAGHSGAFAATLVSFFLVEIGDKTQLATVALAAHYRSVVLVAAGTTAGMMIADVPAVYLGELAAKRIALKPARFVAAAIFAVLGLAAALGWTQRLFS